MTIRQEIEAWDGKSIADIENVYHHWSAGRTFVSDLLQLLSHEACQTGATWLLKHHCEQGAKLEKHEAQNWLEQLPLLEGWQAKLHTLQCLSYLHFQEKTKKKLEQFLRHCLTADNKFVRAWAYSGFYELSREYPEYIEEVKDFFELALRDEAPSVKARIRNIQKKGF